MQGCFFIAVIRNAAAVCAPSGTRTAAQAAAACGGNREPEQGPRSQRRRPAQGALADAGTATCKAPPPCVPAGKNGAVDHFRAQVPPQPDWPERGLYHPLRGGAHAPCKRLHSPRGDRALIVHHTEKSERILLQMRSDLFFVDVLRKLRLHSIMSRNLWVLTGRLLKGQGGYLSPFL